MDMLRETEYAHDALREMMDKLAGVNSDAFSVASAQVRIQSREHGPFDVSLWRDGTIRVTPQLPIE